MLNGNKRCFKVNGLSPLERVIVDDKRTFDTRIMGRVRHYKWTGAEDNTKTPNWQRAAAKWYGDFRKMARC